MNIERLVAMANDIGTFFAAEPDQAEGVRGVANHLQRFWPPTMRSQILAYWRGGGAGLGSVVSSALAQLAAAESAVKMETPVEIKSSTRV